MAETVLSSPTLNGPKGGTMLRKTKEPKTPRVSAKKTKSAGRKKLFVPDTNVLMHDPTALFHFAEHDVFLSMVVLEELDRNKKGTSEPAKNARQASRSIKEMLLGATPETIRKGIPLASYGQAKLIDGRCSGRLFFETDVLDPDSKGKIILPASLADNLILQTALSLKKFHEEAGTGTDVILVSKDNNVYIKGAVLGINVQDYENDQVVDDLDLLYSGAIELPENFWETHFDGTSMETDTLTGRTSYKVSGPLVRHFYPNEFLYLPGDLGFEAIVKKINVKENTAVISTLTSYYKNKNVFGINARNKEQNAGFNFLTDPDIDLVILLGVAGTGKTLEALAAGAMQVYDEKRYREVIVTRDLVSMGEEIGFLPGDEGKKMGPWMGAVFDNLELLSGSQQKPSDTTERRKSSESEEQVRAAALKFLSGKITIKAMNFMRGRTLLDRYLIIDEAQNMPPKMMKAVISRAGPGTKVVVLGNLAQIDSPYLSATTSGLTYLIDRSKSWEHAACITLRRGERSRLADFANDEL